MQLKIAFTFLAFALTAFPLFEQDKTTVKTENPTNHFFFYSADGGNTWQDLRNPTVDGSDISYLFSDKETIYLGSRKNGLFHSSAPALGIWSREMPGSLWPGSEQGEVYKIFAAQNSIFASVLHHGIYRKSLGINFWQSVESPLKGGLIHALVELPGGKLLMAGHNGMALSTDGGSTWRQVYARGWVASLAVSGNVVLASGGEDLLRSTDGGETWTCVRNDTRISYDLIVLKDRILATDRGVTKGLVSADGGKTWALLTGFPVGIFRVQQVGQWLYCAHRKGISRSGDGGKTWKLICAAPNSQNNEYYDFCIMQNQIFVIKMPAGC